MYQRQRPRSARVYPLPLVVGATRPYTHPDWADRVREEVDGVNVAFDGVGGTIGRAAYRLFAHGYRPRA